MSYGPAKRKRNHNYASKALRYHPKRVKTGLQRSHSRRKKGGFK